MCVWLFGEPTGARWPPFPGAHWFEAGSRPIKVLPPTGLSLLFVCARPDPLRTACILSHTGCVIE